MLARLPLNFSGNLEKGDKIPRPKMTRPFTHEPAGGWLPSERISAADALRIYTAGSAAAAGREDELGQIATGMLADFVALDRDITACAPDDIQRAQVLATFVGGRQVYER